MHDCSEPMKVCADEMSVFKSYHIGCFNCFFELGVTAVLFMINALACVFPPLILSLKGIQNMFLFMFIVSFGWQCCHYCSSFLFIRIVYMNIESVCLCKCLCKYFLFFSSIKVYMPAFNLLA